MPDEELAVLAQRLGERHETMARDLVARYRHEIVDYAASSEAFLQEDVLDITRRLLGDLLTLLRSGAARPSDEQISGYRRMLVRRPHQGIALPSIQHAFRLFGEHVFGELNAVADPERPGELRAVIAGGTVVMRFAHDVVGLVTQAYLDELEDLRGDREIVSRSLLEAVLSGRATAPSTRRDARILGIDLIPQNVVVVARAPAGPEQRPRTLRAAARTLRGELLQHLQSRRVLVGVREGDVVALCAVPRPRDHEVVVTAAHTAARALDDLGMAVGVGSRHAAAEDVPAAYAEAREAADFGVRAGTRDRAIVYDDVLLDHLLRQNEHAGHIIAAALGPLEDYDARRGAGLVETLRTYVDEGFSVTRAARALDLHANTVVHRLGRIRELTGRDPRSPRDIVFLALGLRLHGEP